MSGGTTTAVYRRFFAFFRPHVHELWLAGLFLVLLALVEPLIPGMMKLLLDRASIASTVPAELRWPVWLPPLAVVLLFSARASFAFLASLAIGSACNKATAALRQALFARMVRADASIHTQQTASSFINTLYAEAAAASDSARIIVQHGVRDVLTATALTAYLFWMNWQLTLLTLTVLPVVAVLVRLISQRLQRVVREMQTAADDVNYVIEENVAAQRIVRLHRAQADQERRFARATEHFRGRQMRALAASAAMTPVTQISASFALALILSLALSQSEQGHLTVGSFAAYLTAMLMLIPPLRGLGDVFPNVQRGRVALERIFRVLDHPLERDEGTHQVERVDGRIELRGVVKRYDNSGSPALDGIDLSIAPRQTVALVGASGAGKTTLAYLLPRFVAADAGTITLDGVPLEDWSLDGLRRHIAMVPQDTVLLNDTVLANVCLGEPVDEARARQALADAFLIEHIEALPQGLHTVIGHNGSQLSGGQRQRMAIARALYKNAGVLILDEATSALDAESERMVQLALDRLMTDRTTLVIAHRLSTIRHADQIVVMQAGRIAEQGSYDELMARQGVFAHLVAQQLSA